MAEWMDELERLAELRDRGVIDGEEFEVLKEKIIQSSPAVKIPSEKFQEDEEIRWPPQEATSLDNPKVNPQQSHRKQRKSWALYGISVLAVVGVFLGAVLIFRSTAPESFDVEKLVERVNEFVVDPSLQCVPTLEPPSGFRAETWIEFGNCSEIDSYFFAFDEKPTRITYLHERLIEETYCNQGNRDFYRAMVMYGDHYALVSFLPLFGNETDIVSAFTTWSELAEDLKPDFAEQIIYGCRSGVTTVERSWRG